MIKEFTCAGVTVKMEEDNDGILWNWRRNGSYEPESLTWWIETCKHVGVNGGLVLDVGAYTGLYAMFAAVVGCKVIAIEPIGRLVERMHFNSELNGVEFVIIQSAASHRVGVGRITWTGSKNWTCAASLNHRHARVQMHDKDRAIEMITLDSLHLPIVYAIKLDVERHEGPALKGALGLLERDHPPILIEVLDEQNRAEIEEALPPGYAASPVMDERNRLYSWS
jgi:FkbM family methyltransferase